MKMVIYNQEQLQVCNFVNTGAAKADQLSNSLLGLWYLVILQQKKQAKWHEFLTKSLKGYSW